MIFGRGLGGAVSGFFSPDLLSPKNPVFLDFDDGPDPPGPRIWNLSGWYPVDDYVHLRHWILGAKKCIFHFCEIYLELAGISGHFFTFEKVASNPG